MSEFSGAHEGFPKREPQESVSDSSSGEPDIRIEASEPEPLRLRKTEHESELNPETGAIVLCNEEYSIRVVKVEVPSPNTEITDCTWCRQQLPTDDSAVSSLTTASGAIGRYCSDQCFAQSRRASFKRSKTCDWCHHVRTEVSMVEFQEGNSHFQFCTDYCASQFRMRLFCSEAQTQLEQNPHLLENGAVSAAAGTPSNEGLITPELWLHDRRDHSSSPSYDGARSSTSPVVVQHQQEHPLQQNHLQQNLQHNQQQEHRHNPQQHNPQQHNQQNRQNQRNQLQQQKQMKQQRRQKDQQLEQPLHVQQQQSHLRQQQLGQQQSNLLQQQKYQQLQLQLLKQHRQQQKQRHHQEQDTQTQQRVQQLQQQHPQQVNQQTHFLQYPEIRHNNTTSTAPQRPPTKRGRRVSTAPPIEQPPTASPPAIAPRQEFPPSVQVRPPEVLATPTITVLVPYPILVPIPLPVPIPIPMTMSSFINAAHAHRSTTRRIGNDASETSPLDCSMASRDPIPNGPNGFNRSSRHNTPSAPAETAPRPLQSSVSARNPFDSDSEVSTLIEMSARKPKRKRRLISTSSH